MMQTIFIIQILFINILFVQKVYSCECEKNIKNKLSAFSSQQLVDSTRLKYDSLRLKNNRYKLMNYLAQPQVIYADEYKNIKFIGAEKCKLCHSVEYRKWQNTKHAKAYEDMVNEYMGKSVNGFSSSTHLLINSSTALSDCEPCHTTGFGYKFGFVDKKSTNNLTGVQCEICHGPGGDHSNKPKQVKMSYEEKPILEELCRSCHDKEISEKFEFGEYVVKVKCK